MKTIKKILIIADHMEKNFSNFTEEMINCAFVINKIIPVSIYSLLIGKNLSEQVELISQKGIHVTSIELTNHNIEANICDIAWKLINPFAQKLKPDIIITGHNSFGTALLPQLAINMNASCITGVKKITENNGKLIYTRFLYNGKFESNVCSERNTTAISILPGVFTFKDKDSNNKKTGEIDHINKIDKINVPIVLKKISKPIVSDSSFDNADVIVAMGQGIGEYKNIDKIKEFSKIFQLSTIAGSRPMIDKGWLPYKYQVGITGKTVAPIIYIACGISGSSQHIAGMGSSEYIIAVNSDPNAAIFNISDLCIVDDLISFINTVIENLER